MIVVDTNTIAYLYLPTVYTAHVEQLLDTDAHWVAPLLWRSEFRSILLRYLRQDLVDLDTALAMQLQAEALLADNEYESDSGTVLTLAKESGCTAYDCEFVALAKSLSLPLVTADKKLIKTFPSTAVTAADYVARGKG